MTGWIFNVSGNYTTFGPTTARLKVKSAHTGEKKKGSIVQVN
jgi:hypothetical protein